MKKIYLLFLLVVSIYSATNAQTAAEYNFSSRTNIETADISVGYIPLIGSNEDDATSSVVDLGFSFKFAGVTYTNFTVSSNGLLGLGSTPVDVNYWDYALIESLTYPILSAWSDDLYTATDGGVKYKTVLQSNGLKKGVIEWRIRAYSDRAVDKFNKTMQIWLYEGSNKIEFVYGTSNNFLFNNATVGIAASNKDYVIVNTVDHTSSTTNPFIINNVWPGAGRSYQFDPNAPSSTEPITVASSTVNNISCNEGSNGSVSIGSISGGDGLYSISWTGPNAFAGTGNTIDNLLAGTYSYTVTDNAGSQPATGTLTVNEPAKLQALISNLTPANCNGNNGSVMITATGGTSAYTYTLNGVSNEGGSFGDLAAGNYVVEVKDAKGCLTTVDVTIHQQSAAVASVSTSGSTNFCQGSSVTLTASAGAAYLWSNGATTRSINVTTTGNHSVSVTYANGCTATSAPVSTTVNTLPVAGITIGSDKDLLCAGLPLTATSSSVSASYSWSNGSTTATIYLTNNNIDGNYTVKVTDANGCTSVNSAAYAYNKQNLTGSYTIVGLSSVSLGSGTKVSEGSVGVTGSTGSISLGSYTSVAATGAVVKAKSIAKSSPVNAPNLVYAAAVVALPAMQYNTSSAGSYGSYIASGSNITLTSNYKSLIVKAGSTVTLTGNIFGSVIIESGAKASFTNTTVNIDNLVVSNSKASANTPLTYVRFSEGSAIRFSTSVVVYGRSRINDERNHVTFYGGDGSTDAKSFTINGLDAKVSGTIYIPVGTLSVTGTDVSTTTNLSGLFIAQRVTSSGANVVWSSAACTPSAATADASATMSTNGEQAVLSEEEEHLPLLSKFKVYPNLTSGQFNIQLGEGARKKTSIIIFDNNGRPVLQRTTELNGEQTLRFDLTGKPAGMYIVKMISEAGVQSARVFIQK